MRLIIIIYLFTFCSIISAQTSVGIKTVTVAADKDIDEEKIEQLAAEIYTDKSNSYKDSINNKLINLLTNELYKANAMRFVFSKVKSITILTPKDSSFRMFNWNLPYRNGSYKYQCLILKPQKSGQTKVFNLKEKKLEVDNETLSNLSLTDTNWLGAQYYSLIEKQTQFQNYYTLLAWDGNDLLTDKKYLEVLWFNASESPKFGAPIFKTNRKKMNRVVYEFGGQNSMRLLYNQQIDRIILDHLSPSTPILEGVYEYYGSDLSFDGFDWENGTWVFKSDINADVTDIKKKNDPHKRDKPVEEKDFIKEKNRRSNESIATPK